MQLYLDCDGVLADFDGAGEKLFGMPPREYEAKVGTEQFWFTMESIKEGFFNNLDKCQFADDLYARVAHLNPVILTGAPRGQWAQNQKLRWRDKHFPRVPMVVCPAAEKYKWCKPGDILIDDRDKYKLKWECAGGFFLVYKDTKEVFEKTIEDLWKFMRS